MVINSFAKKPIPWDMRQRLLLAILDCFFFGVQTHLVDLFCQFMAFVLTCNELPGHPNTVHSIHFQKKKKKLYGPITWSVDKPVGKNPFPPINEQWTKQPGKNTQHTVMI